MAGCALAIAAALTLAAPVLSHPGRAIVGNNPASDFQIMTWSLDWWPWALDHGLDPLRTHLLWPPGGFSSLWMTTIPVPALLALPLTLTLGPLVAYNVLMLAAIVLATGAAYLLCHELTDRVAPSVLGGVAFGLSPYMLGHTLSQHLDLTFVFPIPLLARLGVRYVRGKTSARRFVVGFAALLLVLVGSSLELFADLALVLLVVGALALVFGRSRRQELARLAALVLLAYAACLPVLVPIAVLGLSGAHGPVQHSPSTFAVDLLNVVVPTPTLLTGALHSARAVSAHFVGNIGERDGYVGVPLLVVSLLALRTEWRRGAWLAGLLVGVAVLLSLGPTLTLGGHPLFGLPFATSGLPVLGDALPSRFSLFAALGLSCLCALWLARPGRRAMRLGAGALVVASLLPNFSPAHSLTNAWAISTAFGWSTPRAPAGFVDDRRWVEYVKAGSTVLVLPTRDRTAAAYWQVKSGMRFALAVPETPFVPTTIAANPTVARLADNVLPRLDGSSLGAARLRAYLLADRIGAVIAARSAGLRWITVAQRATGARGAALRGSLVFRVRGALKPLVADGEIAVARAPVTLVRATASRHRRPFVRAWLHFDGKRAHLRVRLATASRAVTLSGPAGDAEGPSVAINSEDRAAVAFTEWRDHRLLLRVATSTGGAWRVATLDRSGLPIWSQRVAITSDGTVFAAWIDEVGSIRSLRAAVLRAGRRWQRPITLDNGDGLGSVALRSASGNIGVAAWHDSLASEEHVRATVYAGGTWRPSTTLASSLALLDTVTVTRGNAASVRWRRWENGDASFYQARRRGVVWGKAQMCAEVADSRLWRPWPTSTSSRLRCPR